jgi:ElaB/YqjD/DUF883 family membrane-anchored ribosome-binding protein
MKKAKVSKRVQAQVKNAKMHLARAKNKVMEAEKKVESFTKNNPKKALAAAAAAGAVLGGIAVALARRRRR